MRENFKELMTPAQEHANDPNITDLATTKAKSLGYKSEKNLIDGISVIEMSSYREKVLIDLKEKIKTPSKIAKSIKISTSNVSRALNELQNNYLVICVNPEKKVGRLYKITNLGEEVLKYI